MKILITVSGGVVQSVHSDDSSVEVVVYDEDDLRETNGVSVVDRSAMYAAATDGLLDVEFSTVVPDDGKTKLRGGYADEVVTAQNTHLFDATEVDAMSAEQPCEFVDADYFSVFAHLKAGGRLCIGDFDSEGEAHEYANRVSDCHGWAD